VSQMNLLLLLVLPSMPAIHSGSKTIFLCFAYCDFVVLWYICVAV